MDIQRNAVTLNMSFQRTWDMVVVEIWEKAATAETCNLYFISYCMWQFSSFGKLHSLVKNKSAVWKEWDKLFVQAVTPHILRDIGWSQQSQSWQCPTRAQPHCHGSSRITIPLGASQMCQHTWQASLQPCSLGWQQPSAQISSLLKGKKRWKPLLSSSQQSTIATALICGYL